MAVPNVTIEGGVWGEWNFHSLATELRLPMVADAIGRMAWLWKWCLEKGTDVAPRAVVDRHLGTGGADALLGCDLGVEVDGGIRIRGADKRVAQWQEKQESYRKNGEKRAKGARRESGRFGSGGYNDTSDAPANDLGTSSEPPADDQPSPSPSLPTPDPQPSVEVCPVAPRKGRAKSEKCLLPSDWQPRPQDTESGLRDALPGVNWQRELVKFRAHAESTGRKQVNWNASWRLWLTSSKPDSGIQRRGRVDVIDIGIEEFERLRREEQSA